MRKGTVDPVAQAIIRKRIAALKPMDASNIEDLFAR